MATLLPLLFSVLVALAVVLAMRGMDPARIYAMVPRAPSFWIVFAVFYLAGPLSEWAIFHRLWNLPAGGLVPLLRKLVCNELLFGYLGEAYFYTWARRRRAMTAAPFGAIKDVAILSAMAGNGVTLFLLLAVVPFVSAGDLGLENDSVLVSLGVVLVTSIAAMFLRRRIFSLPREELGAILGIHLLRIAATTILSAVLWHMVLPHVPVASWLLLSTLRLLVSRLPFVPNKDVAFAGLAVFTLGHETSIAALMTMMASVILLVHVLLGLALVALDVLRHVSGPAGAEEAGHP
ncbi:hypothetical protein [Novosphingobium sp. RL4]|uniref:hypothetical protein n=1 Tax=Novosphingobium sp. RL4 TaxID=3109595 RepID=UPI002D767CC9|nr:hypothetical protein [Novosphingobium sp. RL4]WRT92259.1 hypothetical protein U9J33_13755 [Novosphingobium sp. RL4]